MKPNNKQTIFKVGSTTYFNSSRFFPKEVKRKVITLYAFVRVVDDSVDKPKPLKKRYSQLKAYYQGRNVSTLGGELRSIVDDFKELEQELSFDKKWTQAFFRSMDMDLEGYQYKTVKDLLRYMYGSAEVIGLMMAKIMNLPAQSYQSAKLLGRAYQFLNFLRDLQEDYVLGRQYIPTTILNKYGLPELSQLAAEASPERFRRLMRHEIRRYIRWHNESLPGLDMMPSRLAVPIRTASNMYIWTARKIYADPFIVFKKKVKPNQARVLFEGLKLGLNALLMSHIGK